MSRKSRSSEPRSGVILVASPCSSLSKSMSVDEERGLDIMCKDRTHLPGIEVQED